MLETSIHPSAGAARAERAAQRAGLTPAEVEQLPFDLSVLEAEGIFVNVDAHGFGLLDRRLDWQALGRLLPDRFRLPLLRPAARAHRALHTYSYRFRLTETLFETPAYRYVPWRAFGAFEAEFQADQAALDEAKAAVLDQYEAVREEVIEGFLALTADSARRLEVTGQAIPEDFPEAVVQRVLAAILRPNDLREKPVLRYWVGVILLGSELLAEQRKAREERRWLEGAEAELRLEQRRRQTRERLIQEELWAEQERLRWHKLDAARERLQEAMSPLEEGAKQLHAAVYEAAAAMRASLQKHQYLHGASAKRACELAR
jgi:hypothetical protein